MMVTLAIARRELAAYLLTPVGWVVGALFLFFAALFYFAVVPVLVRGGFSPGQPASLRLFFQVGMWVLFVIGPALSMRSVSEEIRQGTLEALLAAPITPAQVILGKFAGAWAFLVLMLLPTTVYVFALAEYGRPDYGELLCGYAGLLLVGAALLASGLLASTLTASQVLAYLATLFFWMILLLGTMVLPYLGTVADTMASRPDAPEGLTRLLGVIEPVIRFLTAANPATRLRGFVDGLVDSFNVVYFVSLAAVFLATAVKSLAWRRAV